MKKIVCDGENVAVALLVENFDRDNGFSRFKISVPFANDVSW